MHPLDDMVWRALTGPQQALGRGNALARKYHADVSVFCDVRDGSQAALAALAQLAQPGEPLALCRGWPAPPIAGLDILRQRDVDQLVLTATPPPGDRRGIAVLTQDDVPDMLALTGLTNPGPFAARTIAMGTFYGLRQDSRLIAMAGMRMRLDGYTEVSAVCTHPDYRGRGLGRRLIEIVQEDIAARGETAFLHCFADNPDARRLYERMGYVVRRRLIISVLMKPAPDALSNVPAGS